MSRSGSSATSNLLTGAPVLWFGGSWHLRTITDTSWRIISHSKRRHQNTCFVLLKSVQLPLASEGPRASVLGALWEEHSCHLWASCHQLWLGDKAACGLWLRVAPWNVALFVWVMLDNLFSICLSFFLPKMRMSKIPTLLSSFKDKCLTCGWGP